MLRLDLLTSVVNYRATCYADNKNYHVSNNSYVDILGKIPCLLHKKYN